MFRFMTLTLNPPPAARTVPAPLNRCGRYRNADGGGGRIAVGRNALWRARLQLGLMKVEAEDRAVATVGRPWLTREAGDCAFIVAGDGYRALSCRAPGFSRRTGGSVYCAAHDRQVYRPADDPEAEAAS